LCCKKERVTWEFKQSYWLRALATASTLDGVVRRQEWPFLEQRRAKKIAKKKEK